MEEMEDAVLIEAVPSFGDVSSRNVFVTVESGG